MLVRHTVTRTICVQFTLHVYRIFFCSGLGNKFIFNVTDNDYESSVVCAKSVSMDDFCHSLDRVQSDGIASKRRRWREKWFDMTMSAIQNQIYKTQQGCMLSTAGAGENTQSACNAFVNIGDVSGGAKIPGLSAPFGIQTQTHYIHIHILDSVWLL